MTPMDLRFPAPLRPGARIGVTSPSAGVRGPGAERIEFCVGWLCDRGYDVVVGECMDGSGHVSAPREQRAAEPTWVVGFSDSSTWMVPLTLLTGLATIHGDNLADTPYAVPDGLVHWLDLAAAAGPVTQRDSGLVADWWRFAEDPHATEWKRAGDDTWKVLGGGPVNVFG